jgi:hypothetical protein
MESWRERGGGRSLARGANGERERVVSRGDLLHTTEPFLLVLFPAQVDTARDGGGGGGGGCGRGGAGATNGERAS